MQPRHTSDVAIWEFILGILAGQSFFGKNELKGGLLSGIDEIGETEVREGLFRLQVLCLTI